MSIEDKIRATVYGNCIGDTIGLLTEFLTKPDVKKYYKKKHFEYADKIPDFHRARWETGDWTDDSDQMILIMDSIMDNNGIVDGVTFAGKLLEWQQHGFADLGDLGGMGIGATTIAVVRHKDFLTEPHIVAEGIWKAGGQRAAPNGGVMRTSILGIHQFWDINKVIDNTITICATTHADPRCKASCVAVTTAIAYMLQAQPKHLKMNHKFNIPVIMEDCFQHAKAFLTSEEEEKELRQHMFAKSLSELKLDEAGKIGYTYKTLGAGFWALQQKDFRKALEDIVKEAGDADTNGAVAGALLGCKLGPNCFPASWLQLKHKTWLDEKLNKFIKLVTEMANSTRT